MREADGISEVAGVVRTPRDLHTTTCPLAGVDCGGAILGRRFFPLQKETDHATPEPFVSGCFRFNQHGLMRDAHSLKHLDLATPAEAIECLHHLMYLQQRRCFWIGDLLVWGDGCWGETYTDMVAATGYDYNTLANYKWVCSRIDPSRRRPSLGFSHHREVAKLPPDQQEFILARAEEEGWTREKVSHEVHRLEYETERPAGPSVLSGLHHGDCLEVMATLPDASIDLLLTHPPINGPDALRVFEAVLGCAATKLKPNSHAYIFVDTWLTFIEVAPIVRMHVELRNELQWAKHRPEGRQCSHEGHLGVILFAQKGRRHLNGAREGNILRFEPVPGHPLEKPPELLQRLIKKSTQPKEMVLDPFMGLGGTCLAAHNAGRGYIGIEADDSQRYEEAQRRLAPLAVA